MAKKDIVVVGGSMGGFEAFKTLVAGLPADFQKSIFLVWHMRAHVEGLLPRLLSEVTSIPVAHAGDGGRVEAGSTGLGQGSEFMIYLPYLERSVEFVPPLPEKLHMPIPRRVLVVDDNRDAAQTLALLLKYLRYETAATSGGQRAMQLLDAYQPEVVLPDISMPDMDGSKPQDILKRIRMPPASCW